MNNIENLHDKTRPTMQSLESLPICMRKQKPFLFPCILRNFFFPLYGRNETIKDAIKYSMKGKHD